MTRERPLRLYAQGLSGVKNFIRERIFLLAIQFVNEYEYRHTSRTESEMPVSDRPYLESHLKLAARQFIAGALEGFDPRLGEPVEVPAPAAGDSEDRCSVAMLNAGAIAAARQQAAYARCVELSELSRRLRLARAA
jgi:hypothetical protein